MSSNSAIHGPRESLPSASGSFDPFLLAHNSLLRTCGGRVFLTVLANREPVAPPDHVDNKPTLAPVRGYLLMIRHNPRLGIMRAFMTGGGVPSSAVHGAAAGEEGLQTTPASTTHSQTRRES